MTKTIAFLKTLDFFSGVPESVLHEIAGYLIMTRMRACEDSITNSLWVRLHPVFLLQTDEQRNHTGDNRRGKAGAALPANPAAGQCARDVLSRREKTLVPVSITPVAKIDRYALCIHRPDSQHRWHGRGHMQTLTAVVARCRHDQYTLICAHAYGIGQHRMRFVTGREFSTADVDDMSAMLHSLRDGPRQVDLRTGEHAVTFVVCKDRKN